MSCSFNLFCAVNELTSMFVHACVCARASVRISHLSPGSGGGEVVDVILYKAKTIAHI